MALGNVGNKYGNTFTLLHFFEENKFAIMRLKEVVPEGIEITNEYHLKQWDRSQVVNVKWDNGFSYPARILQFGGM